MILYNPTVSGSLLITGSLTTTGTLTAQTLVVQTITSSVDFVTGSSVNGSLSSNTHQFTGSVLITGSATTLLSVNNNVLFVSASGNVGIGTTSPAGNRKLTVAGGVQITTGDNSGSSFNIIPGATGQAGADLNLSYYTGTDFGPLTFTLGGSERIRITSSGSVGIGTTNPTTALTVNGANQIVDSVGQFLVNTTNSQAANVGGQMTLGGVVSGTQQTVFGAIAGRKESSTSGEYKGYLQFSTINGEVLERMRITSAGNVGIGTSAAGMKLDVVGGSSLSGTAFGIIRATQDQTTYRGVVLGYDTSGQIGVIYPESAGAASSLAFWTYNGAGTWAEKMRITSGGAVCVGTTTSFSSGLLCLKGSSAVYNLIAIRDDYTGPFNDVWYQLFTNASGVFSGGIQHTASTTVSFVTSSDYRLKEDFKQIKGLETLSKIKTYNFKFKDEEFRMDGVIAHELQEVLPYAVQGEKDGERMQGVDYSKLVPVLVKAIQELKAEIDTLKQQQ